ncbi:MAG TPA: alkaline phosphatase family protein [Nitrospiria bacterium]|jgi:predicted AlkP superfamily phosphohydrolase/phosphomutase|nr:alkaline phosphatase family protein [Nitrospiria bacterium]
MTEKQFHPTVLIGLDGATFSVLDPLMKAGVMPFLREFVSRGVRGILLSTPHPLTPPAWTSLMTGRTPGSHGVFDFVRVEQDTDHPQYTLLTSEDVRCETVWSMASREGCRVTTLNFPCMFPPQPINGFVIPGFVPWRYLSRAVYPKELYGRLKARPEFNAKELALDWDVERKALQGLGKEEFEPWIQFHITREQQWFEIVRMLMKEEPCRLTAILFDGVDKLQHLCYYLLDPKFTPQNPTAWEQKVREHCLDYFRQLDGFLAEIIQMAGPEARVFMASDHGFTDAGGKIFYTNVWLEQQGYLKWADGVALDKDGRLTLEGHTGSDTMYDWGWDSTPAAPRTTAFALTASSNGIFIRRASKPGMPGVPAEEYHSFRRQLIDRLLAFRDPETGQPVVERVLTREEAFPGERTAGAPDLTLALRDRSFLSVLRADEPLKRRMLPYGTHHPHGVFMGRGPGIRAGGEVSEFPIINIAPTLLYSLGLAVPSDLEGKPALDAFESEFLKVRPLRTGPPTVSAGSSGAGPEKASMDEGQKSQVMEQLKALGYLE